MLQLQTQTRHFNNLSVTENKRFWKKIKPFFTDKTKNSNNIILTGNYQTIRKDRKNCKIFNTYSTNVTKGRKLRQVDKTQSFENEGSCRLIKEPNYFGNGSFSFKPVSKNDIISVIKKFTIKWSINLKWHTRFSNETICKLLLWKTFKYFERLPQRKQISKFRESY